MVQEPVLARREPEPIVRDTGYWVRAIISGLILVAFAVGYLVIIYPLAQEPEPGNYRFTFSFEALIYTTFIALYAFYWIYRLFSPRVAVPPGRRMDAYNVIGIIIKWVFFGTVGASYLTGTIMSTPKIFLPIMNFISTTSPVSFAINYHAWAADGIIGVSIAYLVYQLVSIGLGKTSFRAWLVEARYPWIKVLWWIFVWCMWANGIVGMFLLGALSPIGPFSFLPSNQFIAEDILRHIHGPMSAVLISVIYGHIYFRIRPEYHLT